MQWYSRIVFVSMTVMVIALLFRQHTTFDTTGKVQVKNATEAPNSNSTKALSAQDLRIYGRLAAEMTFYHDLLRTSWDKLYHGTEVGATEPSASALVAAGLHFCTHLKTHHDIEEAYWFPELGTKMEGFRPGHFASEQHKEMHRGLDVLRPYLEECRRGQRNLDRHEVHDILDSFGVVLWQHMDDEVRELSAENMVRYWSREEMDRLLR